MNTYKYQTIIVTIESRTARVELNRPEVHNAFNAVMIGELIQAFDRIRKDRGVRVAVLTGNGKSFCAGADLNWMREVIRYSFEQNMEESLQIAELHHNIHTLPKPTIALVNGAAIGGGTGFLSACDIALAAKEAVFGLSEVKIGLVPAAISPYVVKKIGESQAREYFLTGRRISAERACEIGLVNQVYPRDELEKQGRQLIDLLLSSGPNALANCKELLYRVPRMSPEDAKKFTAEMIARLRVSPEGQEGMAAFLEKRAPNWVDHKKGNGDV
jgi:methylglutaconyl-CoA hydratase